MLRIKFNLFDRSLSFLLSLETHLITGAIFKKGLYIVIITLLLFSVNFTLSFYLKNRQYLSFIPLILKTVKPVIISFIILKNKINNFNNNFKIFFKNFFILKLFIKKTLFFNN